jgi:hypothetical protein
MRIFGDVIGLAAWTCICGGLDGGKFEWEIGILCEIGGELVGGGARVEMMLTIRGERWLGKV